MSPVERDIQILMECNTDIESLENARTIVLPRAKKHHSEMIKLARQCGPNHDLYEGMVTDAARVRLTVSRFIRRYRAAKGEQG